ncbi:MAG: Asp-tRNA(Asn)/Glu-tRNA(Gln) amidotransferase subunit GatC [Candidatus Harrisonbacteria bacterium]|nr:Asp-tRNA(Asn)/Glu-tRNA(Gln) amidotransferase subunit GatC [Candidatus Harrisonbacteria bacterium]
MSEINKKSLEHLAELARLELGKKEEDKFLKDLEKILSHFKELQSLNTENVQPLAGGTWSNNVLREDGATKQSLGPDKVAEAFPDKEKHWLRVPPVFEE